MSKLSATPLENRLLSVLPSAERDRLLPYLDPIFLEMKQILYEARHPIDYIYFPLSGVISHITMLQNDNSVEVATVGREGIVGLPVFLGIPTTPVRAIIQVAGNALRMEVDIFKAHLHPETVLYTLLQRYAYVMMSQFGQLVACNRHHSIQERCCRWLLMTQDRVETERFPLIQEFMAQMLGVRRASVTEAFGKLQKQGLIHHAHGMMTILDRAGMEAVACECYRVVKEEFNLLLDSE